jgi:hypothetical protein
MESATSVLLWFLGLATTPNRHFWCMSELSNRLFSNNNARFSYVPGFVVKSIMARVNLLPCRFSCESSCKHCEPGFSLIVVPREGTRVHSSLSHRILLWLWKRVRINGIYQFDSDLNRVVKPERDLQVWSLSVLLLRCSALASSKLPLRLHGMCESPGTKFGTVLYDNVCVVRRSNNKTRDRMNSRHLVGSRQRNSPNFLNHSVVRSPVRCLRERVVCFHADG